MKTYPRIIGCLVILALAAPALVSAADKPTAEKPAAKEPAKAKEKLTPLYAQVDSITDTLLTVKGTGPDLKFVINSDTRITKDKAHKEAATVADVKEGQWVGGSYSKAADGSNVLHSLHLGVSQTGPSGAKGGSATKGEPAAKGDQPAKPKQ
jgi:hypothetical protein